MSESFPAARRHRTIFTAEQLEELRRTFQHTRTPSFDTIRLLAARLSLPEIIVKTWFKNQRVKWKKQQEETQSRTLSPGPGPSTQNSVVREEASPSQITAEKPDSQSSASTPGQDDDEPPSSGAGQSGGAAVPVRDSCGDSLPDDIKQIALGDSLPPWADNTCDVEAFVKLYDLPGDEDPSSLDKYLCPGC